jgi:hypothetical protein
MIVGAVFVAMLVCVGSFVMYGVSAYNGAIKTENSLVAQYEQNQNNLSQYSNKIGEMVQIPTMYKNDYKEVITGALQGRYGKDGSQAMFQFLKEHEINFDSSLYGKIQDAMVIGRDKFENEQKKLIDRQRVYQDMIGTVPKGLLLKMFGFPTNKVKEIKIVKSGYSNEAFDSGVENGIKLN